MFRCRQAGRGLGSLGPSSVHAKARLEQRTGALLLDVRSNESSSDFVATLATVSKRAAATKEQAARDQWLPAARLLSVARVLDASKQLPPTSAACIAALAAVCGASSDVSLVETRLFAPRGHRWGDSSALFTYASSRGTAARAEQMRVHCPLRMRCGLASDACWTVARCAPTEFDALVRWLAAWMRGNDWPSVVVCENEKDTTKTATALAKHARSADCEACVSRLLNASGLAEHVRRAAKMPVYVDLDAMLKGGGGGGSGSVEDLRLVAPRAMALAMQRDALRRTCEARRAAWFRLVATYVGERRGPVVCDMTTVLHEVLTFGCQDTNASESALAAARQCLAAMLSTDRHGVEAQLDAIVVRSTIAVVRHLDKVALASQREDRDELVAVLRAAVERVYVSLSGASGAPRIDQTIQVSVKRRRKTTTSSSPSLQQGSELDAVAAASDATGAITSSAIDASSKRQRCTSSQNRS